MRKSVLVLVFASLSLCGCFCFQREVDFSGTRQKVAFENVEAARAFHKAVLEPRPRLLHSDMKLWVVPPFFLYKHVLHEKEFHNYLVRKADVDRNGVITVPEAGLLALPAESQQ